MSDLLNSASLVLIPSGYKEDIVYSAVPTDGSGDLSFTRASNGTRINSAGLVEVCPWNLAEYSEDFSNAYWQNYALTITANTIAAPNGITTADTFTSTGNFGGAMYKINQQSAGTFTTSVYVKAGNFNLIRLGITDNGTSVDRYSFLNLSTLAITNFGSAIGSIESVGNDWYRFIVQFTSTGNFNVFHGLQAEGTSGKYAYFWGYQLNIGSTAKPYFPTTDRLNVPRLTYQNGGGGCPSLLLEKQSTNLVTYSEQFDNANGWSAISANGGSAPIRTANYGTSPDGTQSADRIQLARTTATTSYSLVYQSIVLPTITQDYTYSVWLKALSGTPTIQIGSGQVTLTNQWVRYTQTVNYSSGTVYPQFAINTDDAGTSLTADFLAWGFQLEASSYPTSYIPTTSASATRVADACFKTGISSLIGQTEGVIFVDFVMKNNISSVNRVISLTETNWLTGGSMRLDVTSSAFLFDVTDNSGGSATISYSTTPLQNTRYKVALSYKQNDCKMYINGVNVGNDTITNAMPTCSEIYLNELGGGFGGPWQPTEFNQVVLFKTQLTNAELIALTTL